MLTINLAFLCTLLPFTIAAPAPAQQPLSPWPPANGLNTIRVPRDQNVFTPSATSNINAPADLIFRIIRNTTSYPDWNTFTPRAVITKSPQGRNKPKNQKAFLFTGDEFTFDVVLNPDTPEVVTNSFEKVFDISTPKAPSPYVPKKLLRNDGSWYPDLQKVYRASWGDVNPATATQLVTERFSEVIEVGKAKSVYRTWENFGGPFAPAVQASVGDILEDRFEDYAREIKAYAEKVYVECGKKGLKDC